MYIRLRLTLPNLSLPFYIENWFMLFYLVYTLCSFLVLAEFHLFNYPFSLDTIPNHVIHKRRYWENWKPIIVNYRRDAAVIMKWANIFFEVSATFGFLAIVYPIFFHFLRDSFCGEIDY